MSTRANIIIQDDHNKLFFYRHSDGYPDCCFEDLKDFVKNYTENLYRDNVVQSAGHLIIRGHNEYAESRLEFDHTRWKCGAYEPTTEIHGDVEYVYTIDLSKRTLSYGSVTHNF